MRGGPRPRRWRPSLTTVLTLGFGGMMLLALGTMAWLLLATGYRNTEDLLRQTAQLTIDGVVKLIEQHLGHAENQAEFLAELVVSGELDLDDQVAIDQLLLGSLAAVPQVRGVALFEANGDATRVGGGSGERIVLHGDWRDDSAIVAFMAALQSGDWTLQREVVWVPSLRGPHIVVDAPIRRDGRFLGVVSAVVGIAELSRFLPRASSYEGLQPFVLFGPGRVLAHPALAGGLTGRTPEAPLPGLGEVDDPVLARIWDDPLDEMKGITRDTGLAGRVIRIGDEDHIFIYRELTDWASEAWIIGGHLPSSIGGVSTKRLSLSAMLAGLILIAGVALAFLLGRAIARPVRDLSEGAEALRGFEFDRIQPLRGSPFRELDTAAQAYNAMLDGLRWFAIYVPRGLVERLMREGSEGARSETREVTVLFTDIVGFTGLSQSLEAERLAELLNRHFALVADCIAEEDGSVDKYIGDSVMAFWGAPGHQPDRAARACRAALAISRRLAEDNRERRQQGLPALRLRVGIHTGPVLVGNIGAPGRVDYTLVGDTVNVAQRLEGLGRSHLADDQDLVVLLGPETAAAVQPAQHCQPLGSARLSGRSGETEVFRLSLPEED